MTIAPNGVTVGSYDPKGIGAIAMAAIKVGYAGGSVLLGATVDGDQLEPSGSHDSVYRDTSQTLGGGTTWMCLGYGFDSPTLVCSTIWMRVA